METNKEAFELEVKERLQNFFIKSTTFSPTTLKSCELTGINTLYELLQKLKNQKILNDLGKGSKDEIKKIYKSYGIVLNKYLQPIMIIKKNK